MVWFPPSVNFESFTEGLKYRQKHDPGENLPPNQVFF